MFCLISNASVMSRPVSSFFSALLLTAVSLFLFGCKPTVETVEQTSDQAELANIVVEASDSRVRLAAIAKLADQVQLASTATTSVTRRA